ncbi:MAG: TonB-dependent receptor plug domain-containing protein [Bacteroidia bacterium]
MKKFVKTLIFTGVSGALLAQTDSHNLQPVIIKENRLEVKNIANSLLVLKAASFNQQAHKSVADVLGQVSGMDMRQRGPVGVQTDVSIRGGSFDQTQVLWNGLKLNDAQTGHHNMNLPFPTEAIENIVISKNSAARKYGLNAYSGYINLVTQVPKQNLVYGCFMAGDYGLWAAHLGVSFRKNNWGHHISVKNTESNGYTTNTDFKTKEIFYQTEYKKGNYQLDIFGGYAERAFGARGFYVPNSTEFETTKSGFVGIKNKYKVGNFTFLAQGYYRNHDDNYIYLRVNPSAFTNQHYTNTYGAELHATYSSKLGVTGMGFEWRQENLNSYNYSGNVRKAQLGNRSRQINGFFVEHQFVFYKNQITITPGFYTNLLNGSSFDLFPGFDFTYKGMRNITFFGSIDKAMRLPTYTDLYYSGSTNIGNAQLVAEQSINSEIGVEYKRNNYNLAVSYFNKNSNNTIDWAKQADSLKWQPLNINHVQTDGLDVAFNYFTKGILNKFSVGYTYIDMQLVNTENYKSRYALSNLKHQLIVSASLKLPYQFLLTTSFRHIERVVLVDYQLLDARLNWSHKAITAFVDVSNILDKKYLEAGYAPMPNTWSSAGIQFKINYKK